MTAHDKFTETDHLGVVHTQPVQIVGTTDSPTTASTSFVDLEEMSITLTTGNTPILVLFNGVFCNDTVGNTVGVIVVIDDVEKTSSYRYKEVPKAACESIVSTIWLETLSAAEHTIKIQWKVDGGTGTAAGTYRVLEVIELKL